MSVKTIADKVAENIQEKGSAVAEQIIEGKVKKELDRRVGVVSSALGKLDKTVKSSPTLAKPDLSAEFDAEGNETKAAGFTEAGVKALEKSKKTLKKHEEKIAKFEAAIDKALEDGTEEAYAELEKLSAKVNNTTGDDDDDS